MLIVNNPTRDIPRGNLAARTAAANEFWSNLKIARVERDLGLSKPTSVDFDIIVFADENKSIR